jgi:hypothetical protein
VFLLTLYKIKPSDGNKRRQQTEEEVDNRKQRSTKITREGMKRFIVLDVLVSMPMSIKV